MENFKSLFSQATTEGKIELVKQAIAQGERVLINCQYASTKYPFPVRQPSLIVGGNFVSISRALSWEIAKLGRLSAKRMKKGEALGQTITIN